MKKLTPKRRFKGFADPWEQRKLGKLGNTFTGLSGKTKEDFGHGNAKFITYMNVFSNPISDFNGTEYVEIDDKQNQVKFGDVFFTTSSETPEDVGMSSVWLDNTENIYLNSFCFGYRPTEKIDPYYLAFMLRSPSIRKEFMFLAQGISRYNISKTKVMEMRISIPKLAEQVKVGEFFRELDHLITLHQCKLEKLKVLKTAYLYQMFPQEGESIPELRFQGFTDPWEQRRLGEVANHRGGTAIEKHFDKNGKYKVISIGSYGLDSKYVDQNIRATSNEITDARVVRKGELTMVLNDKTSNGTIIGRSLLIDTDDVYVINQRTEIISPREDFDSNFAYVVLNGPFREKVKRIVQGGTQIYVNYPVVENLKFELPTIEEQQKIGNFFNQLDSLITLHQCKFKRLKALKQAYLSEMFV